ncbi:MAG TPA: hypothetical protein DDY49_10260 [Paenibacillaceae bacterium]|nr:hypothetical protein [Paenibacillaceae bacterium]
MKNKKMKWLVSLLLICGVGACVLIYNSLGSAAYVYSPESEYDVNYSAASFSKNYDSIEELYQEADLVARVKVTNHNFQQEGGLVHTVSNAQLLKVYKGDSRLKTVKVYEVGGQVDPAKLNLPEKEFDQGNKTTSQKIVEDTLEGSPTMRSGNHYVVFLKKYPGQDFYNVVGSVQGKIKMDKNNQLVGTVKEERVKKDELFFLQKDYSGKNADQLEKQINKLK